MNIYKAPVAGLRPAVTGRSPVARGTVSLTARAAGDCPFKSLPAQHPHLTPPQPRPNRPPDCWADGPDSLAGSSRPTGRSEARHSTALFSYKHSSPSRSQSHTTVV
ncbi:hypothetical protein JCM31271_13740 [Halorubrum trueperi]